MAPNSHYQYIVIGGGSGGMASARRAAQLGAKTLLIEGKYLGGTCVNVGCVPKKVMWNAADLALKINHISQAYNFEIAGRPVKFNWAAFKAKRDAYIQRLRNIYASNLQKDKVDHVSGWAELTNSTTVKVKQENGGESTYTGDKILLATGGAPIMPEDIPGAELGTNSDGFFAIETQPRAVAIVGAGYIGVEISGLLNALGTESHLLIRGDTVLRKFDDMIQKEVTDSLVKHGVNVHRHSKVTKVEKSANGRLTVHYATDGSAASTIEVDHLIWAVGRHPLSRSMNLSQAGVRLDEHGKVIVDEYQTTSVPNIFSVGDLSSHVELTPAAIAAGRKLSRRLFGGETGLKQDYENIPSVIFSHPEAGSIGLTEKEAREKFDKVKVYSSRFINMFYSPCEQEDKEYTHYKLICEGDNEKVVGLHIVGDASSEILQGFGVAIKMGATKADFDSCVAIHPTAAEELVTMT